MSTTRTLGSHAVRGGAVVLSGQIAKFAIQGVGLVVLSRALTPEVFGVIALMTAVVGFGEMFRDFGLTSASIQAKSLSQKQASNLFWINLSIGLVLAIALISIAPLLSKLFDEPQLLSIAPWVSLSFLILGAQAQFQVSLSRSFNFRAIVISDVAAQMLGTAVAITCALLGFGLWSLVAQLLVTQSTALLIKVLASKWLPSLPSRGVPLKQFYSYGGNLLATHLLTYTSSNVDTYMIGYRWGPTDLGLYNRAFTLMALPIRQALSPLTNVFLPIFSKAFRTPSEFFPLVLKVQFALGAITAWGYLTAAALSEDIIAIILGSQWLASSHIFQILAIGGAFQIFSHLNYWVFLATGETRSLLYYNLITKPLTIALVIGASFISVEAIAAAYTLSLVIAWPINVLWLKRKVKLPASKFLLNGLVILTCALLSAAGAFYINLFISNQLISLVLSGLASLVIMILALAMFRQGRVAIKTIYEAVKRFIVKRQKNK